MAGKLFTEDEEIYLEYYILCGEEKNFRKAAEFLGCTTKQIRYWRYNYAKRNKIGKMLVKYSQKEIDLVKRFHGTKSIEEIAKILRRPKSSVKTLASDLGLCNSHYPSKKDSEIRILGETKTLKEISEITGIRLTSLRSYVYHQKIPYKKEGNSGHVWRTDDERRFAHDISRDSE